jgi:two-component system, OmpR family, alkaline phosphatase synthesis response regulator PhoP
LFSAQEDDQPVQKLILVADDEPHIRLLIEQSLEDLADEGVEIVTVGDGQTALDTIKERRPQLVVLDAMMPRMNGFDVCNAVKMELALDDVYVIILTAKGQEYDRQRGEQVGANLYMTKPFDPDELLARAREVLGDAG